MTLPALVIAVLFGGSAGAIAHFLVVQPVQIRFSDLEEARVKVEVSEVEVEKFSETRALVVGREKPVNVVGKFDSLDTSGVLYCLEGGECAFTVSSGEEHVVGELFEKKMKESEWVEAIKVKRVVS